MHSTSNQQNTIHLIHNGDFSGYVHLNIKPEAMIHVRSSQDGLRIDIPSEDFLDLLFRIGYKMKAEANEKKLESAKTLSDLLS